MVPSWADQLLPQLLMEQFDTLPIQCRLTEHMHEGVWFRKNNFWQNDSCENLDNFSLIGLLYMHRWCLYGPINSYHSFWWSNLILCLYNVDTLNICMKESGLKKIFLTKWQLCELCDNYSLIYDFCICMDSAFMARSTPTTAFEWAIWYFADTMQTHWTYAWRSF